MRANRQSTTQVSQYNSSSGDTETVDLWPGKSPSNRHYGVACGPGATIPVPKTLTVNIIVGVLIRWVKSGKTQALSVWQRHNA